MIPLMASANVVVVTSRVSPGRKSVVGLKMMVLPLALVAPPWKPNISPPRCWLNTRTACLGRISPLNVTLTLVLAAALRWLRVGETLTMFTGGKTSKGSPLLVAVGVVITLAAVDRRGWAPDGLFLVGSLAGLVYALVVRFLAIAHQGIDASLTKVPANVRASAQVLGARRWRLATRIELPMARAGILAATALVAVDALKELPVTLLLRPFGTDTLSVWVWQATSEALWIQAAVPSLAIVSLGMVLVIVLLAALERGGEVTS